MSAETTMGGPIRARLTRPTARASLFLSLLILAACDSAPGPGADASPSDGSPEGDFEVTLARRGAPIDEQDLLPVDFGCQGGAHVELDVGAVAGAPMRGATFTARVDGGPEPAEIFLTMSETPQGAEAAAVFVSFGDFSSFVDPERFDFPVSATLRVTVEARDGTAVTAERGVRLEMGSTCTCTYNDPLPGAAVVGTWSVTGEATGCDLVEVRLDGLTFTPDDANASPFFPPSNYVFEWPAQCVDALALDAGSELRLELIDSFPGQPCTPAGYFEGPSPAELGCGC